MIHQTTLSRRACGQVKPLHGRGQLVVRAAANPSTTIEKVVKGAASAVVAASVVLGMTLGGPTPALAAPRLAEKVAAEKAAFAQQLSKMEYAFEQQQTAARAEIVGKRQQLENTVEQVDTAIQRKLIEEKANEQAAKSKGEELLALRIEGESDLIKQQQKTVQVAAAKAEAQLDRAEMVVKAREVEQQQQVAKATDSMMDLLGLSPKDLGM